MDAGTFVGTPTCRTLPAYYILCTYYYSKHLEFQSVCVSFGTRINGCVTSHRLTQTCPHLYLRSSIKRSFLGDSRQLILGALSLSCYLKYFEHSSVNRIWPSTVLRETPDIYQVKTSWMNDLVDQGDGILTIMPQGLPLLLNGSHESRAAACTSKMVQ